MNGRNMRRQFALVLAVLLLGAGAAGLCTPDDSGWGADIVHLN